MSKNQPDYLMKKIQYGYYLCKTINLSRICNYIKLLFSFFLSEISKNPKIKGKPYSLSIEPSGFCNLKCPECPVGSGVLNRKGGNMSIELYKKILTESQPELGWLNLYFQGEPFLNQELFEMIGEAQKLNIFTSISTNGHFLNDENCQKIIDSKLSEIIISIDGITDLTYSKYRKGGDLQKVKEGVIRLIEKRESSNSVLPFVTIQFLVFKHNEKEIPDIMDWCKKEKVDKLKLKTAQLNDFGTGEIEPPSMKKYSRYIQNENGTLSIKKTIKNHCFKQWSSAVFSYNGQMAPCCYDKDLHYSPGNIKDNTLEQLWNSSKMNNFRKNVLKNKKSIIICNNCPEGRGF